MEYVLLITMGLMFLCSVICLILIIVKAIREARLFRLDDRNPYIRWCKRCGQRQDEHTRLFGDEGWGAAMRRPGWWEDMAPVPDPNCLCHHFSRYYS